MWQRTPPGSPTKRWHVSFQFLTASAAKNPTSPNRKTQIPPGRCRCRCIDAVASETAANAAPRPRDAVGAGEPTAGRLGDSHCEGRSSRRRFASLRQQDSPRCRILREAVATVLYWRHWHRCSSGPWRPRAPLLQGTLWWLRLPPSCLVVSSSTKDIEPFQVFPKSDLRFDPEIRILVSFCSFRI